MKAVRVQEAMIVSRYFVACIIKYDVLSMNHIDDYV